MSIPNEFRLYVLELHQHKWFLYFANPADIDYLWINCASIFPFVNKYLPIKTFETIEIDDMFDIDHYVKKYMFYWGIENVRGGTYSHEMIDEDTMRFLKKELTMDLNLPFQHQFVMDKLNEKYNNFKLPEEFIQEREFLKNQLVEYKDVNEKINKLSKNSLINRTILKDLEWIIYYMICVFDDVPKKISSEDRNTYKKIINKLKTVTSIFKKDLKKTIEDKQTTIFYYMPEFFFDKWFLHSHNNDIKQNLLSTIETAEKIIRQFENMIYSIINRLEEYEFDLSTYPENYEQEIEISLRYLDNLIELKN